MRTTTKLSSAIVIAVLGVMDLSGGSLRPIDDR